MYMESSLQYLPGKFGLGVIIYSQMALISFHFTLHLRMQTNTVGFDCRQNNIHLFCKALIPAVRLILHPVQWIRGGIFLE
jgi:hypothetical protein